MNAILLEDPQIENGRLHVFLQANILVNITAELAQRKVTRFVATHISSNMAGRKPVLLFAARPCWRVPVHLAMAGLGDLGSLATVHVDIETGEFLESNETITQQVESNAAHLAPYFPRSAAEPV